MRMTRRNLVLGALGAGLMAGGASAGTVSDGGHAFGSSWRVTVPEGANAARLRPGIEAIIAEIDASMSPYRATSDLSRFNRAGTTAPQTMPSSLCHVGAEALRVAEITGGHFDPTVGPLVARLGFGPISGRAGTYREIEAGKATLRKRSPSVTLDLCGIAKGYALDVIAAHIAGAGIGDALIEVGGEVRALGRHPDGRPWAVAIADPLAQGFAAWRIVAPGRLALATSGHAANGVSGRVAASHIIDPKRGTSASMTLASVSVLAPSAMRADALATALCAAGPEAGPALAWRLVVDALFLVNTPAGLAEHITGDFTRHIQV